MYGIGFVWAGSNIVEQHSSISLSLCSVSCRSFRLHSRWIKEKTTHLFGRVNRIIWCLQSCNYTPRVNWSFWAALNPTVWRLECRTCVLKSSAYALKVVLGHFRDRRDKVQVPHRASPRLPVRAESRVAERAREQRAAWVTTPMVHCFQPVMEGDYN